MSSTTSRLPLVVNMQPSGVHAGAWLLPESDPRAFISLDYHAELARLAELGRLDALFFADFAALQPETDRQPRWTFDPIVTLSALAALTRHVGLVASISTTLTEPYPVARTVASLDHVSGGRAGWNVVTSFDPNSARNHGLADLPDKASRYRRAQEFLEVVDALWGSWEEGALVLDRPHRRFVDTGRVHAINHTGPYFSVAGPLQVPTPPQVRPVVFQAGGSDAGRDLAAQTADAVFAAQLTLASARDYRDDLRQRARAVGRDPDEVKLFPGVTVTVGRTRDEALAKRAALNDLVGTPETRLAGLAHFIGVDPADLDVDRPLPDEVRSAPSAGGAEGFRQSVLSFFDEPGRTVGDFLREGSLGHRTLVGTPEDVADSFEEWLDGGAADGFVLMFEAQPSGLRDFVELVVPELQRRGLTRTEYADDETLATRLGLPRAARPTSVHHQEVPA